MILKSDSRKIVPGDTFIAIRNVDRDGHDYIEEAINNGAVRIICEYGDYSVETEVVPDTTKYLKDYYYENVYPLIKDLKLIGITGTSGKTTTSYLIYQMFNKLGAKCAYIGTIGFYLNDEVIHLNNTTPNFDELYTLLLSAKEAGCEYVVMEVSSHSLSFDRVMGLEFDTVAFTNLSPEHMDYHKNMNNYMNDKLKLFSKTRGNKNAIINIDDEYASNFILDHNNNFTISKDNGDLDIREVNYSLDSTNIKFFVEDIEYSVEINMAGNYNVYNYLMALSAVYLSGYNIEDIINISDEIVAPPGRLEFIKYNGASIYFDYAHTPDGYNKMFATVKEFVKGKIYTLFGSGGDRDKTKRPIMCHIAEENSEFVILTTDNPRTEDPKKIMKDNLKGMKKDNHIVIDDRAEAIVYAMDLLEPDDVLLILGKGREDYQIIGHEKIYFNDYEEVQKYINDHK